MRDRSQQGTAAPSTPLPALHSARNGSELARHRLPPPDTQEHSPVELRDDFSHSLSSPSRCWDNVLGSTSAIPPQLPRGPIHCLLCGCDGMDSGLGKEGTGVRTQPILSRKSIPGTSSPSHGTQGVQMLFLSHEGTWGQGTLPSTKLQTYHKTLHDAKVVMDDLGQGRQAVSSARGIAEEEREEGSYQPEATHLQR